MAEETDRSTSPEPELKSEQTDSPIHAFAKDQLKGVSFLAPDSGKRITLEKRLGRIFPQYEAQVLAHIDILRNGMATKHEGDAKRRAMVIFRDWQNEQRKTNTNYDEEFNNEGELEDEVYEDLHVNEGEPVRDESVFRGANSPRNVRIMHDDYSDEAHS